MARTYPTLVKASEAWLRRAKFSGAVRVLGGGWWQVGSSRPIQGHLHLSAWLQRRGFIVAVDGGYELRHEPQQEVARG